MYRITVCTENGEYRKDMPTQALACGWVLMNLTTFFPIGTTLTERAETHILETLMDWALGDVSPTPTFPDGMTLLTAIGSISIALDWYPARKAETKQS
jgi:hypothetical protein